MKTYRPLVVLLFAFICGLTASAQDSSEIASLRVKAVKGNGIAQYNLGLAYAEGRGVAADPIEAFVWLSLARENGARGRALDNLVGTLDKTTYEAAQKRLAERKAELGHKLSTVISTPAPAEREIPAAPDTKPAASVPAPAQPVTPSEDPALAQWRAERDTLKGQITDLTGSVTALHAERESLIKLSADHEKTAREAVETSRAAQEKARASEGRVAELVRTNEAMQAELERTKQSLTALQKAPAPDTTTLDQRTRELQATRAELEASRNFGTQVENTLNKVTDQKTALESQLANANSETNRARQEATALAQAKDGAQQKLGALTAEHFALQSEVGQLRQRPAAPAYPDLSSRVRELESNLADTQRQLAAKPAAPGYPDLSSRVSELESQLAKARQPAVPKYPDLSGRVRELESSLADTQRQLAAKPAAPAYPDLRTNVAALETQLTAAQQALAAKSKPAAPAYPDLSGRVAELEKQLTTVSAEASRAKQAAQADVQLLGQKLKQSDLAMQQAQESYTALQAEAEKLRARPAPPAYPDLSDRVREQEHQAEALRATVAASAQELADTRGKFAATSAELFRVASARSDAQAQVAALTKARDEAQQQLNAIAAEHAALQSEVAQLRQRPAAPTYPDLSGRVAELETALAASRKSATTAAPALAGKVGELETALADTNRQLIAAQNAAAAKPAAPGYPDLSAKVGELEAALAATTQKAGASEQARAEVAKQFDDYKSSTIAAQRERTTMLAQVKMLESDKAALRRQAEAATAETGQLRTQVAALKMQQVAVKPAAPAYPDLSGKVGELEARVGNLTAALAAKPTAPGYPDLSGRVNELESQLAQARQPAATPKYPDLSGRVRELESSLADAQHRLAAKPITPNYPDLSGRVNELETALAAASLPAAPKYPNLTGRVRELEAQVSADKSAVASANEEAVRAKQEAAALAQAKAAIQTQVAALTTERDSARSAQSELRDTIAKLTEEKVQLSAASKAAPAYPDLRERVATLESDLAAAQKTLAAKPAAPGYPDLSGRVGELEAALAALSSEATRAKQEVTALTKAKEDAKNAAPAYPDLSTKVGELEARLATAEKAATEKPAGPAYPDLSGRVTELTSEVAQLRADRERMQKLLADTGRRLGEATAATRSRPVAPPGYLDRVRELETALAQAREAAKPPGAPAYPDLSGRVRELEAAASNSARQLIAAEAAQAGLKKQLAEAGTAAENAAKSGDDTAKLRRERDELSGRVTDLAGEVAQLRTDRERMQKMLADAGRQMRDDTASATRIKDLETQLAASQAQAGGITAERDAVRNAQNELRETIAKLEQEKSPGATTQPAAPAYPDLSGRVRELEAQVTALASAPRGRAPNYPDLSGRVSELETALAEARQRAALAPAASGADASELQKKLADTEDRLATALRGYAILEKERNELTANAGKATEAVTAEKSALAAQVAALSSEVAQLRASAQNNTGSTQAEIARLNEALTALQRSTAQNSADLAATRTLAQQLQGANAVLAGENYQLKTMLSRTVNPPGAVVTAPTAVPVPRTHVVAGGDSLSRLSQRYYGTASRWQEIYNANTDRIAANGLLRIGTELRIP